MSLRNSNEIEIGDQGEIGDVGNTIYSQQETHNSSDNNYTDSPSILQSPILDRSHEILLEKASLIHRIPATSMITSSNNLEDDLDRSSINDFVDTSSDLSESPHLNIKNRNSSLEESIEEEYDGANHSGAILHTELFSPLDSPINHSQYTHINTFSNNHDSKLISKRNLKMVVIVLLISNLGFGTFFSYTSPEALSLTFYNTFRIDSKEFGSLFTLYAIPNVCMVFITGILVDVFGPDPVSIILSLIVTLSTFIGALSPPNFKVMLFSRFLLGFAGESLVACSNALMTKWFNDKLLSTFLGVAVGWIYGANLASLIILPILNKTFGFRISLWFICLIAGIGTILNITYLVIKKNFKDISKDAEIDIILKDLESTIVEDNDIDESSFIDNENHYNESDIRIMPLPLGDRVREFFYSSLSKVKGIFSQLPARMWVTVGIVFFGYTAMYGLAIIGPDLFHLKYGFEEQAASLILSSETLCSCLLSPVFGVVIRKIGRRLLLLVISIILLAMGIILLETTNVHPLPWIIISGTGFALLNTTVISSLPLYIPKEVLGTGYGFIGTAYNTALVIYPPILGALKVSTGTYSASLYLLFGNCIVAMILVGVLISLDLKAPLETRLS